LRAATADSNTNSAGDSVPPPLEDPELAATLQTLTGAAADPKQNVLLLQLAYYDAQIAALEAHFNVKRDERCFELWNGRENQGKDVDGYEYDCWCGPRSAYSAIHCHAYSDALGNATMHKMEADNRKQPGFGNVGSRGGGGRRLAEAFEALQRPTGAARSLRTASPVGRRALMSFAAPGGKGVSAAADNGVLSTAVAPYYGSSAPLASPSTALVASLGRRRLADGPGAQGDEEDETCGFDGDDATKAWKFIKAMTVDTIGQNIQCVLCLFVLLPMAGTNNCTSNNLLLPHAVGSPIQPHQHHPKILNRGPQPRRRGAWACICCVCACRKSFGGVETSYAWLAVLTPQIHARASLAVQLCCKEAHTFGGA
jgi:hypothetical protein